MSFGLLSKRKWKSQERLLNKSLDLVHPNCILHACNRTSNIHLIPSAHCYFISASPHGKYCLFTLFYLLSKTLITKYHVFDVLYLYILTGTTLPANKHNINFEEIQLLHRCERWDYQGTTTFGTLGLRYSAREQTSISEHISFPPVYNIILNS